VPPSYNVYKVQDQGIVVGEQNMMNEIFQRGPISCNQAHTTAFIDYQGGIFDDHSGAMVTTHVVVIVGWGQNAQAEKYWIVKNSWGTMWGQQGYYQIVRGVNNMNIETQCTWATPLDTWTVPLQNFTSSPENKKPPTYVNRANPCRKRSAVQIDEVIINPQPYEYLQAAEIPSAFDWRNVSGTNFITEIRNEDAPHRCGACWAQSTTSLLADRINIKNQGKFPVIMLSPQVLINCMAGGDCAGGDPLAVYNYAYNNGIPEDTCNNYLAANTGDGTCSGTAQCKKCWKPFIAPGSDESPNCWAFRGYNSWKVSEFGQVAGVERMQAEIYARGPIGCGIHASILFEAYNGGIFIPNSNDGTTLNHEVSLIGWGEENGVQYWIGRNSWGTFWGENGFFRIQMGVNALRIEELCHWGIPYIESYQMPVFVGN
jgi:cathepsin X